MKIETMPVASLCHDPKNLRKHPEDNLESIKTSLTRFGQQKPIVVDQNNIVIAGNGTLMCARDLGWEKIAVVRTKLNGDEAVAFAIADNRSAELAMWDETALKDVLQELQKNNSLMFDATGFDQKWLDEYNETGQNLYTKKIEVPIYEPKGECPPIAELSDGGKTLDLLNEINRVEMEEGLRNFLRSAAHRHTVFNFENIAEYYAHATPQIQRLMERSGLVIVDFDKAVEYGFVQITEQMSKLMNVEAEYRESE